VLPLDHREQGHRSANAAEGVEHHPPPAE
jgi:hypothetical protein